MQLAAVDIGSNAIRLQVVRSIEEEELVSFKKVEYMRFPLRLGHDVFTKKEISVKTAKKFIDLMKAFKILIDLYEVQDHIAVATSAMREASNGREIIEKVKELSNLSIQIIDGELEADILSKAIVPVIRNGAFLHIDVGGGSTELNLYENKIKLASKSFNIGSVRKLSSDSRNDIFQQMKDWMNTIKIDSQTSVKAVGTGGNINKIYSLANVKGDYTVSIYEIEAIRAYISSYTLEQRVKILKMNPDRADVIIPASEIYLKAMKACGAKEMMVPGVGLKDGLIYNLYEKAAGTPLSQIKFLDQLYMEH
jgi:exopolyphosphatase/guanosine-5'-triphosphate,3'-diphosphate pyrophosphatase